MPPSGLRRATVLLRPLRNRELRALWLSDWISDVGNFITAIALAVYINNLTGTVTGVGVVLALHSVPWSWWSWDRPSRRRAIPARSPTCEP